MKWPDDFINKVICGDCNEIMPLIPEGVVDAVVTDPPYGINLETDNRSRTVLAEARQYPKVIGDDKRFDPRLLLQRFYGIPLVLFGANHYAQLLPDDQGWLVWDKTGGALSKHFNNSADCELAWTNCHGSIRIFHHLWHGLMKDTERQDRRVHPTQKPVALMKWIIDKWTKENDLILDPYAGSGSTLVAAKQLNRRYIGIEISPEYCQIAEDRLRQIELFGENNS